MSPVPGDPDRAGPQGTGAAQAVTVVTLLSKVHPYLGVKAHEFTYNDQRGVISYVNGSSILLVDVNRQPSDPDFDTFGSLELTHVVIEEVGEVVKKAVDVLSSRRNRYLNVEYGLVGKTVQTCNPTYSFVRAEYYDRYRALGSGPLQRGSTGGSSCRRRGRWHRPTEPSFAPWPLTTRSCLATTWRRHIVREIYRLLVPLTPAPSPA